MSLWGRAGEMIATQPKSTMLYRGRTAFRIIRLLMAMISPEASIFELVAELWCEFLDEVCCFFGQPP